MAVIPTLGMMAALTLLYNPEGQAEGSEIDYTRATSWSRPVTLSPSHLVS